MRLSGMDLNQQAPMTPETRPHLRANTRKGVSSVAPKNAEAADRIIAQSSAVAQEVERSQEPANRAVEMEAARVGESERSVRAKAAQAVLDLKKNGWACVDGILPMETCEEYQNGFWDWLESLNTGVRRDDPETWRAPHWPTSYRGIINSFEVAHQSFVWRIRKHPNIRKVFEEIWGSSALLSSFDSINALPPNSTIDKKAWLHVDQAPFRKGACCIQGLVNLVDVSPQTTGTLLVKSGTHNEHERFFTSASVTPEEELRNTTDHYKFKPKELSFWEPYESVGVSGAAGSLFLWDSRAVHANVFPEKTTCFRHVVYTCYQPASMADEAGMAEKKRMYENYLISTHWPAMNVAAHGNGEDYFGSGEKGVTVDLAKHRTRYLVEDDTLLKLTGMLPYTTADTSTGKPMVDMTEEELMTIARG